MTILLFIGALFLGLLVFAKIDESLAQGGWFSRDEERNFLLERQHWVDNALLTLP